MATPDTGAQMRDGIYQQGSHASIKGSKTWTPGFETGSRSLLDHGHPDIRQTESGTWETGSQAMFRELVHGRGMPVYGIEGVGNAGLYHATDTGHQPVHDVHSTAEHVGPAIQATSRDSLHHEAPPTDAYDGEFIFTDSYVPVYYGEMILAAMEGGEGGHGVQFTDGTNDEEDGKPVYDRKSRTSSAMRRASSRKSTMKPLPVSAGDQDVQCKQIVKPVSPRFAGHLNVNVIYLHYKNSMYIRSLRTHHTMIVRLYYMIQ